jgi:hypothetical protein
MFSVWKQTHTPDTQMMNELTQKVVDFLVDVLGPRQIFGSFDLGLQTKMKINIKMHLASV